MDVGTIEIVNFKQYGAVRDVYPTSFHRSSFKRDDSAICPAAGHRRQACWGCCSCFIVRGCPVQGNGRFPVTANRQPAPAAKRPFPQSPPVPGQT